MSLTKVIEHGIAVETIHVYHPERDVYVGLVTFPNNTQAKSDWLGTEQAAIEWARERLAKGEIKTVAPQFRGIPVPKYDAVVFKDREVPARCKLERRIVWNLLKHLEANGWLCFVAFDGECSYTSKRPNGVDANYWTTKCGPLTKEQVMDVTFNLDEVSLRFGKTGAALHGVWIILGNGVDCISDWNYSQDDPDGFDSVISAFDTEKFV